MDGNNVVVVSNLSRRINADHIKEIFSRFGKVENILMKERKAFLKYENLEQSKKAVRNMNNYEIDRIQVVVETKEENENKKRERVKSSSIYSLSRNSNDCSKRKSEQTNRKHNLFPHFKRNSDFRIEGRRSPIKRSSESKNRRISHEFNEKNKYRYNEKPYKNTVFPREERREDYYEDRRRNQKRTENKYGYSARNRNRTRYDRIHDERRDRNREMIKKKNRDEEYRSIPEKYTTIKEVKDKDSSIYRSGSEEEQDDSYYTNSKRKRRHSSSSSSSDSDSDFENYYKSKKRKLF